MLKAQKIAMLLKILERLLECKMSITFDSLNVIKTEVIGAVIQQEIC